MEFNYWQCVCVCVVRGDREKSVSNLAAKLTHSNRQELKIKIHELSGTTFLFSVSLHLSELWKRYEKKIILRQ